VIALNRDYPNNFALVAISRLSTALCILLTIIVKVIKALHTVLLRYRLDDRVEENRSSLPKMV